MCSADPGGRARLGEKATLFRLAANLALARGIGRPNCRQFAHKLTKLSRIRGQGRDIGTAESIFR
jgi:hypothetical protein